MLKADRPSVAAQFNVAPSMLYQDLSGGRGAVG